MKKLVKVIITLGALVYSYKLGEKIEEIVKNDETIPDDNKPLITVLSCTLSGYIIGLITRYIIKKM